MKEKLQICAVLLVAVLLSSCSGALHNGSAAPPLATLHGIHTMTNVLPVDGIQGTTCANGYYVDDDPSSSTFGTCVRLKTIVDIKGGSSCDIVCQGFWGGDVLAYNGFGGSGDSGFYLGGTAQLIDGAITPSQIGADLAQLARNREHSSSKDIPGTNHGRVACANRINEIFKAEFGRTWGKNTNLVPDVVKAMDSDTCWAKFTDSTKAEPGDVAVEYGNDYADAYNWNVPDAQGHIGVCMTSGCNEIDSNSTGDQAFENNFHDPNMGHGTSEPSTFYRYVCQ
jgi:hypothetical protein